MRIPILTYEPMRIDGAGYESNDLKALAADLRHLTQAGFRILPLRSIVDAWIGDRGHELTGRIAAITCDNGADFDFVDLPHPTQGVQRSVFNILRDFAAELPGAQPSLRVTPAPRRHLPEARAALDSTCMLGKGWWSESGWTEAIASGLVHIASHSWDHNHETLPESFSLGVARGTFASIAPGALPTTRSAVPPSTWGAACRTPARACSRTPTASPMISSCAITCRKSHASWGFSPPSRRARDSSRPGAAAGKSRVSYSAITGPRPRSCRRSSTWRSIPSATGCRAKRPGPRPRRGPRSRACGRSSRPPSTGGGAASPARASSSTFPRATRGIATHCPSRSTLPDRATPWTFPLKGTYAAVPLAVNTHLLPNGRTRIGAKLVRDGADAGWQDSFDIEAYNTGPLADTVRESLHAKGTPPIIAGFVDSSAFALDDPALTAWFDRPDAHEHVAQLLRAGTIGDEEAATLRKFVDDGYTILPESIEEDLLARINREFDDAVERKIEGYEYGTSQRIRNLHLRYPGARALWQHPSVMRYLELIFGVPARPCQSLTYIFGSQQGAHQDTIHLTPFPAGYMCGVWVALEDVRPDSGELEVYRGSHRLPRVYMEGSGCGKVDDDDWSRFDVTVAARWREMLASRPFEKVTYRPRRGTVLIWHENLMHAGGVRLDTSLSRRSIVSHYFADGSIAFYDSSGVPGHME